MKSKKFFQLLSSLILLTICAVESHACGPYNPVIPTPEFFGLTVPHKNMSEYEREENLRLWQSMTSERIPLDDIEEIVYRDSWSSFYDYTGYEPLKTDNLFYIYLKNSCDSEITDLLGIAKTLEKRWRDIRSLWYYPRKHDHTGDTGDFHDIIEQCKAYDGERLKDRYALQVTRALFASRDYASCIEYSDSAFAYIPDSNLMKRMAQRYAAGCWSRLGDADRADSIFAKAGDIWSISADNRIAYMTRLNPAAPQFIDFIRENASDTTFMREMRNVAEKVIRDRRITDKGDWNFVMSYIDGEFNHDESSAREKIYRAMRQSFSSDELKDLARSYKMKLDGRAGITQSLIADLKWMESKISAINPQAEEWIRRCRNIIYVDWVPLLWEKGDYSTAILLCAYADNIGPSVQLQNSWKYPVLSLSIHEIRNSEYYHNPLDYGCLSFQMMGNLTSRQLISVYKRIRSDKPLYKFLRRKTRNDSDYYYELIGTLALREENYNRAVEYLSKVSDHYLRTMNIDKDGYLSLDPFVPTFQRNNGGSNHNAKLKFAQHMLTYSHQMKHGGTADERGIGRLMYAIGLWNSIDRCWALTQYWEGTCCNVFRPSLEDWYDDFYKSKYHFIYDRETTDTSSLSDKRYKNEVAAALAMLKTDEAKAQANYILGKRATIIKLYCNTSTARFIKTSCDNWRNWL